MTFLIFGSTRPSRIASDAGPRYRNRRCRHDIPFREIHDSASRPRHVGEPINGLSTGLHPVRSAACFAPKYDCSSRVKACLKSALQKVRQSAAHRPQLPMPARGLRAQACHRIRPNPYVGSHPLPKVAGARSRPD